MEKIDDKLINNEIIEEMNECNNCSSNDLIETGTVITKDVVDYKIITEYTRHYFKEYKCKCCGKIFHKEIPNNLKEECQYGNNIKTLALTLSNVENVAYNKIRRILSGLSMNDINPCEGYLSKLQIQASKKLTSFLDEAKDYLKKSSIIYWDDTVIMVNKKQSCLRFYGNEDVCLFKAHKKKNKAGLDKDNILNALSSNTVVEHDHNKVNYNSDYSYINAECCQHLLRDLKKVEVNIPNRTWCKEMIKIFQEFDHKRKELIERGIDSFSDEEINQFVLKIDEYLLLGYEENKNDSKPYYSKKELTLINRILEYRDNYIYWILDFDLPFTNNLSERNLRGVKSKMKVAGQFQNIDRATDYANIRSYIETCRLYGISEYESLKKLVNDEPYTLKQLINLKK